MFGDRTPAYAVATGHYDFTRKTTSFVLCSNEGTIDYYIYRGGLSNLLVCWDKIGEMGA